MRLMLVPFVAVVLALASTAYAEDGPGGHLAGTFTATWQGNDGKVSVALDPGTAARDAAVAKIKSGEHYRTGDAFSTEGAHVTALSSSHSTSYDCGDGTSGTNSTTFGAIRDP